MLAELALGRAGRSDAVGSLVAVATKARASPRWSIFALLGVVTGFLILSLYSVIGGWAIAYLVDTIVTGLPGANSAMTQARFDALLSSPARLLAYHFAFMTVTAVIVARGISRGIEEASKILMPCLAVLIAALALYAVLQGDFRATLRYLFAFDVASVTPKIVLEALGLGFFSIGAGFSILITYAAYAKRDIDLTQVATVTIMTDTVISFLAGFAVFPIVFAENLDPSSGPGLVFVRSSQCHVEKQHHHQPDHDRNRRLLLEAMLVGFRDDLVADHIDHRPCGKRHGPWQQQLREAHRVGAEEAGERLHQAGQAGDNERVGTRIAAGKKREGDRQPLRRILQPDAARQNGASCEVAAAESDPDRKPLRQIVNRDGEDEQPDAGQLAPRRPLTPLKEVLVRDRLVQDRDETAAQQNSGDGDQSRQHPRSIQRAGRFQARNDQGEERCREHDARREAEQHVVQPGGDGGSEQSWDRAHRRHETRQEAGEKPESYGVHAHSPGPRRRRPDS
jgi:hypothetical protein